MDVVVGIATVVLVIITAVYATATILTVREMRTARKEERERAEFERSRAHAVEVRSKIVYQQVWLDGEITRESALDLYATLEWHGPLISNAALRARVRILALVAFTASWSDDKLSHPDRTRYFVSNMARYVQRSIDHYLRDEPLPKWPDDYPMRQWAQAWATSGADYTPDDESARAARAEFDSL